MSASLSKTHSFSFAVRLCVKPRCPTARHVSSNPQLLPLVKPQLNPVFLSCAIHEKSHFTRPSGQNSFRSVVKSKVCSSGFKVKSPVQSCIVAKVRAFSNSSSQETVRTGKSLPGKALPWLDLDEAKPLKRADHESRQETSRSSWKESAKRLQKDSFTKSFSRQNVGGIVENRHESSKWRRSDLGDEVEEEQDDEDEDEDEGEDVGDDPRWDRIKTRFRGSERPEGRWKEKPELRRWNKQENWGKSTWKEATGPSPPKLIGQGVYGVGPVLAALSAGRREFYTLYVQEGLDFTSNHKKKKDKKRFERVLRIAERIGLTVKDSSKHDLNMVVDNRPHQGLVLDASPLEMEKITELDPEEDEGSLWIALDEVTDPQNLGAIIRSAYFFGASGVVLCAKNSAPLSGVVSKASAGSLELMELRYCKNMMQFLTTSAENGWRVLGGSVSSRSVPLSEVSPGGPTILVMGSEGTGLRPLVERSCTQLIRIPGNVPVVDVNAGASDMEELQSFLAVESLNVSVAAGVLLHHFIGNNSKKDNGINDTLVSPLE